MLEENMRKIETIDDYLQLKELAEVFDFSNDGASEEYRNIDNKKTPYEKFFAYNGKPDPDSGSKLLQKIYNELWDDELLKFCRKGKSSKVFGETLISQNTTLNKFYMLCETPDEEKERKKSGYKFVSAKYLKKFKANNELENKLRLEEKKDYVGELLGIYHTLGNFMPFPYGCNGPRGIGNTKDYCDLMLYIIWQYYSKEDNRIDEIVSANKSGCFIKWLDKYGKAEKGWNNFIEMNFLQDFVNENNEPQELWKGHFADYDEWKEKGKGTLPTDKNKIEQFYNNGHEFITKRTKRMLNALNGNVKDGSSKSN